MEKQDKIDIIKCKLAKAKNHVTAKKTKIEKKNVENFHCLTVDTGAFFIRSNGKVSVTGNCHSEAGAKTFKVLKEELQLPRVHQAGVDAMIYEIADVLFKHEEYIVEKIFSHGEIEGITKKQLLNFVKSRIDLCLRQLGYEGVHNVKYNPIADWFYDGISGFMFNDTFSGIGNSYVRNWDEDAFVYETFDNTQKDTQKDTQL